MRNEKKKKKKKRNRIIGEGGEDESENRMLKVIEMINFFLSYREQFVSEGKEIGSSVDGRNHGLMVIFTLTTSRLCMRMCVCVYVCVHDWMYVRAISADIDRMCK